MDFGGDHLFFFYNGGGVRALACALKEDLLAGFPSTYFYAHFRIYKNEHKNACTHLSRINFLSVKKKMCINYYIYQAGESVVLLTSSLHNFLVKPKIIKLLCVFFFAMVAIWCYMMLTAEWISRTSGRSTASTFIFFSTNLWVNMY